MMRSLPFLALSGALLFTSACSDSPSAHSLVITGSSTVAPVVADAARRYEEVHPDVRIDVQTGGSSRGIADARSGLADLGMASRALKPDESDLNAHSIAVDGVCLIAHRDNPIANLTKEQAADIFQKRKTNWKEFGGKDAPIVVASKAEGRATLEVFLAYLGLDSADLSPDVIVGENQQAIKTVAGNPNAIGYVSIGAASSEAAAGTPIRLISSDAVPATAENVANGSFPITRPLNMITVGQIGPAAQSFLNFLQSASLRDIVESHLYVPVTP